MTASTPTPFARRLSARERWGVRLLAFMIWAVVAASAAYWVLRSPAAASDLPDAATVADTPAALSDGATLARLLGQQAVDDGGDAAGAASSDTATSSAWDGRVVVHGVMAQHGGMDGMGVAILAVDGQAARPYRLGQVVADGWQLHAVQSHAVVLALPQPAASASSGGQAQHSPQVAREVVLPLKSHVQPAASAHLQPEGGRMSAAAPDALPARRWPDRTLGNVGDDGATTGVDRPSRRFAHRRDAPAVPAAPGTSPVAITSAHPPQAAVPASAEQLVVPE